jgi:hypothetical protein
MFLQKQQTEEQRAYMRSVRRCSMADGIGDRQSTFESESAD